MALTQKQRSSICTKLATTLGEEDAETLMVQFDEVATKQFVHDEVGTLRNEMHLEFTKARGEMTTGFAEIRGEMAAGFAKVDTEFAKVRGEMTTGFAELKQELGSKIDGAFINHTRWMIALGAAMTTAVGVVTAVLR